MVKVEVAGVFLIALMSASAAFAGDPPTPRQPIGPNLPKTLEMLPPFSAAAGSQSRLPGDRIRIFNIGDQRLFLAYWDGDSAWQQLSVDSGQSRDVVCSKCADAITVAYHNGKENTRVKATGGVTYVLSWSAQAGVWTLTPR